MKIRRISLKINAIATNHPKVRAAQQELDDARKAVNVAADNLKIALRATPEWAVLQGFGHDWPNVNAHDGTITMSSLKGFHIDYDFTPGPQPIDPKTLHVLLTGRLLSDAQKLKLLRDHGVQIDVEQPGEQAVNGCAEPASVNAECLSPVPAAARLPWQRV